MNYQANRELEVLEPEAAFPYRPPNEALREKYSHIFSLEQELPPRLMKTVFDKVLASIFLLLLSPIVLIIKIAYTIEGLIVPSSAGPMFFYYHAISAGKVFRKYKIRVIKTSHINQDPIRQHDWASHSAEWGEASLSFVGRYVKAYYLDEIPQFYAVLKGEMSIVGPRPLAEIHFQRDVEQGNVSRKLLKGGLLGLGHLNKGTDEMGNPEYEYEYIDRYLKCSGWQLFKLDLTIIYRGVVLMLRGGGH